MTAPENTGSHAVTEKRGGGLLWLWLLLGALALALIVWAIAAAFDDDDDAELDAAPPVVVEETEDPTATDAATEDPVATTEPEVTEEPEATEPELAEQTPDTAAPAVVDPNAAGIVLVGDVDILATDTDLAALVGEPVQANEVEVREVVADEAFFVGPQVGQTVLVRLAPFAGEGAPESPFTVEEGDVVSFTGTLQEIDEALLSELELYTPAQELETGEFYVQVDEISGVR